MMPQTIARYQIRDKLGDGGMGIVYRAYDPNLLREVALKVIFKREFQILSDVKQDEILARFLQEAKIIGSLHHIAIMPIYDFGWENGEPFIVMPLMRGGTLDERLEAGALPLDEIVRILDWIAPALDKVHRQGIIHRDLKPSNILFDEDDKPNIADFGLARLTKETMRFSQTGIVLGTPAYMSPEQARGDKDIDHRSDIYSLGCMLFEMLTGEPPYYQVDSLALVHFHINEPAPRLDELRTDLPREYQAIIDRAMAKTKEKRYRSAGQMSAALKAVVLRSQREFDAIQPQSPARPSNAQRATAYLKQGLAAYNKGNYEQAIAYYDQAIYLNPNDALAYNRRGQAYYAQGDYDQAIADYSRAIYLKPNNANAYHKRGQAYYNQGSYDQAIADYDQAIYLNPNNPLTYNSRGNAYYGRGNYNQAITNYSRALRLNPNYATAYHNRGNAYRNKGNARKAIADCDKAIRLKPDNANAYHKRGLAYHDQGHYSQAIADYSQAIYLDPNYAIAYHNRGRAYHDQDHYSQAIAHYSQAIDLDPDYALAYYSRGIAYEQNGNTTQAISDYHNVLALNNDPQITIDAWKKVKWLEEEAEEAFSHSLNQLLFEDVF